MGELLVPIELKRSGRQQAQFSTRSGQVLAELVNTLSVNKAFGSGHCIKGMHEENPVFCLPADLK